MLNSVQKQIVEGVANHGWFVVNYVPGPGDPQEWFTYTVGLTKMSDWPELIVFNPDQEMALAMLRNTIGECWGRRIKPEHGLSLIAVLQNKLARIRRLEVPQRYFAMADWYADHTGTSRARERLQVMWPDKDGRFPDDPDCDPEVREWQTPKVSA